MRFSDEKLQQFHDEFIDHIKETESQFESLTQSINDVRSETKHVIQLANDIENAINVIDNVQKFGLWIIKWPIIGAALYAAFKWIRGE